MPLPPKEIHFLALNDDIIVLPPLRQQRSWTVKGVEWTLITIYDQGPMQELLYPKRRSLSRKTDGLVHFQVPTNLQYEQLLFDMEVKLLVNQKFLKISSISTFILYWKFSRQTDCIIPTILGSVSSIFEKLLTKQFQNYKYYLHVSFHNYNLKCDSLSHFITIFFKRFHLRNASADYNNVKILKNHFLQQLTEPEFAIDKFSLYLIGPLKHTHF